jgi:hypothetical protein
LKELNQDKLLELILELKSELINTRIKPALSIFVLPEDLPNSFRFDEVYPKHAGDILWEKEQVAKANRGDPVEQFVYLEPEVIDDSNDADLNIEIVDFYWNALDRCSYRIGPTEGVVTWLHPGHEEQMFDNRPLEFLRGFTVWLLHRLAPIIEPDKQQTETTLTSTARAILKLIFQSGNSTTDSMSRQLRLRGAWNDPEDADNDVFDLCLLEFDPSLFRGFSPFKDNRLGVSLGEPMDAEESKKAYCESFFWWIDIPDLAELIRQVLQVLEVNYQKLMDEGTIDDSVAQSYSLTKSQTVVLNAMSLLHGPKLLTIDDISHRSTYGPDTVGKCIKQFIDLGLAERPEGSRQGARLTMKGLRLEVQIRV